MKALDLSKTTLIKGSVIFSVFLIFISNAIGLVEITISHDPLINISSQFFNPTGNYNLTLEKILISKEFLFLLSSGLILTFALPLLSPAKAFLFTSVISILTLIIGYLSTNVGLIPIEYCLLTILVSYMMNVLVSYFIEIHTKQNLIEKFGQYIPPQLVNELSRLPDGIPLEGESKILSVFFCDLQNFTSISEQLNPKQLNKLLNEYFTVMSEIIFKHGGTIDKYIGDAIMAFWNAPTDQKEHAQRSVEAALEMNQAIQVLAEKFINHGWPKLSMGAGINTGRANVGNMGSKYRMTYTAIGDAVNLASRIESLTRTYRVPLIISEHTMKELNGITCREIDQVRVRGKQQLTRLYQPLCYDNQVDDNLKDKLRIHAEAMALYYEGKEKNACRLFKDLYERDTSDKFYKAIIQKIMGV